MNQFLKNLSGYRIKMNNFQQLNYPNYDKETEDAKFSVVCNQGKQDLVGPSKA